MNSKLTITILIFIRFLHVEAFVSAQKSGDNKREAYSKSWDFSRQRIVVLNAYHQKYHWADQLMDGVFSELGDKDKYELYIEYMDTKRCSDSIYYQQLKEIYLHKYRGVKVDGVLACDENALNFMLQNGDDVFPEVPVSFCGIVGFDTLLLKGHDLYAGVYEGFDVADNLEFIKRVHPQVNHIVFISDSTSSGKALIAKAENIEPQFKDKLTFEYLIHQHPDSLKKRLSALSETTAVMWCMYVRMPDGSFISTEQSIDFVTSCTHLPVYCLWDVVGQGVVGGNITPPFFQGAGSAKILKRILKGEDPSDIEITKSLLYFKFDYNQLEKYEIDLADLPNGSIVINRPTSFWQKYSNEIVWILFVLVVLLISVFTLIFLYRKSRRAEGEVKRKNTELEDLSSNLKLVNQELKISKSRAEESDKLKTAFLANLSHEIRTPMNGIMGFADLLRGEDVTKQEKLDYLGLIESSGQRMLVLIDDLVNVSKIESGTLELVESKFELNNLLKTIFLFFEKEVKAKGLKLKLKNDPDIIIVRMDRTKLEQILYNLLRNALKFTHQGSIEFGYLNNHGNMGFYVKDSGIGIPKEKQNVIFERFVQVNDNRESPKQGVGLGLAIVKEFVDLMGGKIQLDSEKDKGSLFVFTIPCEKIVVENVAVNIGSEAIADFK